MSDKQERNLKVIETEKSESKTKIQTNVCGHSNPLTKKFLEFYSDNEHKLKVKDLFKK